MNDNFSLVEQYLRDVINPKVRNEEMDNKLREILKNIKEKSVHQNDQQTAKMVWCFESIHSIQINYLSAFLKMKEGFFYKAWCLLAKVEIEINNLSIHFPITENDPFKLKYIEKHTKQFQSLFPYKLFISPAFLYLEKKCSICGEIISVRRPCGHIKGEIYNGEMCAHEITKGRILELSVVPNPVQKYSVLFMSSPETGEEVDHYDYSLVKYTISGLQRPFDGWNICHTKIRHCNGPQKLDRPHRGRVRSRKEVHNDRTKEIHSRIQGEGRAGTDLRRKGADAGQPGI